jgi:(E)-4-hydroxy-3-methyl-but-2-enyl pyrophosphate reductase
MKITISKFAGFCPGAKRAYDFTIDSAKNNKNLHILGDLLHNNDIINKINSIGVKKVDSVKEVKNGKLIITAHGDKKIIFDQAKEKNIEIINTTCPKVIKIQQIVKKFHKDGLPIIIFGDKNHKEVRAINGWCDDKAIIINNQEDLDKLNSKKLENAIIVSQTTQRSSIFEKISTELSEKIKNVRVFDTICDATKNRQDEVKKIAKKNDGVIVIGGKNSANSKKLFEISSNLNPKTFFIENIKELNHKALEGLKSIGITAGASTPDWVIQEIYLELKKYES